jgi:uncharacterized protein (DUF1501 family)
MRRRGFLKVGTMGLAAMALARGASATPSARSCIMVLNAGAPAHLDTWDPKPDAPREVRGPFGAIATRGDFQISGAFPLHARIADRFSIVRGVACEMAPLHELGCQLAQTGHVSADGASARHIGDLAADFQDERSELPGHVILPRALDGSRLGLSFGQPFVDGDSSAMTEALDVGREPLRVRERYGHHAMGRRFLAARRLVERGVRFVTLNPFESATGPATWDVHGARPFATMDDFKCVVAPMYDQAFSALVEDLSARGMLDSTMVAALSDFGRTPWINRDGGRDHWTKCWSVCFAGGGVQGGRVIGESDEIGAEPRHEAIHPRRLLATIRRPLGLPEMPDHPALHELF